MIKYIVFVLLLVGCAVEPVEPVEVTQDASTVHGNACMSVTDGFCEAIPQGSRVLDAEGYCISLGAGYVYGTSCPAENLIGCCGDSADDGGTWACFYDTDFAPSISQGCKDWKEEAP